MSDRVNHVTYVYVELVLNEIYVKVAITLAQKWIAIANNRVETLRSTGLPPFEKSRYRQ